MDPDPGILGDGPFAIPLKKFEGDFPFPVPSPLIVITRVVPSFTVVISGHIDTVPIPEKTILLSHNGDHRKGVFVPFFRKDEIGVSQVEWIIPFAGHHHPDDRRFRDKATGRIKLKPAVRIGRSNGGKTVGLMAPVRYRKRDRKSTRLNSSHVAISY